MKSIKIVIMAIVLLLVTACGNKTPFSAQQPLENSALVYVYASSAMSSGEGTSSKDFNIRINNKRFLQRIKSGEYMAFNLKPEAMTLSATRSQIEEKVLKLNLQSGQIYYLRIKDNMDGDKFEFEQIANAIASKEITKTGLAGSSEESPANIITEFVNPKEDKKEEVIVKAQPATVAQPAAVAQPVANTKSLSKSDEIEKAYNLKEKGILSEQEYKALKTEILAK
ncbi:MAG: DUF2846 domain-containing protein [Campylobacterales bacterium]|nr:DUF2846 domain-containing protein [Campylobacterales bacterium]